MKEKDYSKGFGEGPINKEIKELIHALDKNIECMKKMYESIEKNNKEMKKSKISIIDFDKKLEEKYNYLHKSID